MRASCPPSFDTCASGQPPGTSNTALPRHVPVVDLGPGRLHGNQEPCKNSGGQQSKKGRRDKKNINDEDNDSDTYQDSGAGGTPLPRRGSVGNIEDRVRQGKTAVWGGRGAPNGGVRGGGGGCGGEWWDTGTPYAFQPRLAADKATVVSFIGKGGRRDGAGVDQSGSSGGNSGADDGGSRTDSRSDGVDSGLSLQHQQQQLQAVRGGSTSRELMRIVKVPDSNEHHGQRVFFLA